MMDVRFRMPDMESAAAVQVLFIGYPVSGIFSNQEASSAEVRQQDGSLSLQ